MASTTMTKKELEAKVEELRRYKAILEEAENAKKAIEHEIISYMEENALTEEVTDTAKISYKAQERKSLNKELLEEAIGDLTEFTTVTTYNVLRVK